MNSKVLQDPRHRLHWYRLTLPNGGYVAANPFDGAKAKVGLGVEQGVQHYRDSLGRIQQVAAKWFSENAKRVYGDEAQALWLPLEAEFAIKRFPGLEKWAQAEQEKAWNQRKAEKEEQLRQKQKLQKQKFQKQGHTVKNGPSARSTSKPAGAKTGSGGSGPVSVEVVVKKPRRSMLPSPGGSSS